MWCTGRKRGVVGLTLLLSRNLFRRVPIRGIDQVVLGEGFQPLFPGGNGLSGLRTNVMGFSLHVPIHGLNLPLHPGAAAVRDFLIHLCYFAEHVLRGFAVLAEVSVCGHISGVR